MDNFATLARDFGFRPHGKSAPMTASGVKIGVGTDAGDQGSSSVFFDKGNRDGFLFNNGVGGPTKVSAVNYTNSKSASTLSDLDYDSIFKNSSSTTAVEKAKNGSSSPVYDKPVYDEDIFDGLPGLKSKSTSFSGNFENVFASISPPKSQHRSAGFDDLHENFDRTAKSDAKSQKSTSGLDDLLPGFGGASSANSRPLSESNGMFSTANSTKPIPTAVEDPFVLIGSISKSRVSSPDMFTNPLDVMDKIGHSGKTEVEDSSSRGVFDNINLLNGFGKSVPTSQIEMNTGYRMSTEHNSSDSEPIRRSQFNGSENHFQKKMPYGNFQDPYQTIFEVPGDSLDSHKFDAQTASSYVYPSYNVDATSTSEAHAEPSDEVWLTVSDFPIVTQVTRAPPPSRPPPPIPSRYDNEVKLKEYTKTSRTKEAVHLEKDEQTTYDDPERKYREMQEMLESEHRQREEEEKEQRRLEEEKEQRRLEEETEQRRLEKERERAREIAREREKGRQAVERATREARERAAIEARERAATEARQKAERIAVQRVQAEARERAEKAVLEARERSNAEAKEKETREKAAVARAEAHERAEAEARERAAVARAEAEARERAAAEARQRAERSAVQRVQAEARERASVEARERAEKAGVEARERANADAREKEIRERAAVARAGAEARRRAERAAVDRVAAEARDRAAAEARERAAAKMGQQKNDNDLEAFFSAGRASSAPKTNSRANSTFQSKGVPEVARTSSVSASSNTRKASLTTDIIDDLSSIFGAPTMGGFEDVEGESDERRRARLERQQRTQERAAKALAEKNQRDLQTLREQEERHRIAETLDFEIKRWAAGKEGNLRALLSTLQYVLWPESGWQPVSLTDLIMGASVKKFYRKATLCIHPDKVQQKGATLQQKYIAEKIFDILKEAWNKFNSEELF